MITDVRTESRVDLRQPVGPASRWQTLRPVLIFHLATRALVVIGLVAASAVSGRSFPTVVTRWDGLWYLKVAVDGYPSPLPMHPNGRYESSTAAFFPLYPLLIQGLLALGIPYWLAGMLINLAASTAAVLIIVLVGQQYLDRRPAQLLGCLWTAFPMSVVLSTTYTEAVFTMFGAAALLFAFRRRWLLAGLAAALAGAVRSPGILFAGAVGIAALEAIIRRREWRSLVGAAIAPLGFLGSVGYIGWRTGTPDAWRLTEHDGWHTTLMYGAEWLNFLRTSPSDIQQRLHLIMALFGIVLLALVVAAIALRPPLPLVGLMIAGTFSAFAFGGVVMNAAPRLMMSIFPILAPLAIVIARWPPIIQWLLLGAAAVAAGAIGGYAFGIAPLPV